LLFFGCLKAFLSKRILVCILWLLAVWAGGVAMLNHDRTSSRVASTPEHWPAGAKIPLDPERGTLIVFAHPRCPYTRASMGELSRLLARYPDRIAAHVFFLKPTELTGNWNRTGLWRNAAAIPNLTVHEDLDGKEARRFGAETSGYVVFYAPQGELLFKGGITAGRGHAGDNPGAEAIGALIAGQMPRLSQAPVYGCSLMNQPEQSPTGQSPK